MCQENVIGKLGLTRANSNSEAMKVKILHEVIFKKIKDCHLC